MKDYFEINVDDVDKSGYKKFVVDSISDEKRKEIEEHDKKFQKIVNERLAGKKKLDSILYYLIMIFAIVSLILALIVFQRTEQDEVPVALLIILAIILGSDIVLGIIYSINRKKIRKEMKGEEFSKMSEENKDIEQSLLKILKVPEGTQKYDIFVRSVHIKNNQVINALKTSYNNYSLYVYKKDDAIYFCDTYELIKLKEKEIKDIKLINDKITFSSWNKKEPPADSKYKPYKVKPTTSGLVVNCFYEVKIERNNEDYILRIPGYEKELMENVFSFKQEDIVQIDQVKENPVQENGNEEVESSKNEDQK